MKVPHMVCPKCFKMQFFISIVEGVLTFTCAECIFEILVEGQEFKATGMHILVDSKENNVTAT